VGTAYRHFPNKYALARAVLAGSVMDMLDAADRAARLDDAEAGLAAFFDAVLEPQAAKRALGRVMRGVPDTASPVDDVHTRIENCIDTLLKRAREQRVVRPDVTATDIGVLMSVMGNLIERFGDADPHLWRRFLPILLDGLRADAPTPWPVQRCTPKTSFPGSDGPRRPDRPTCSAAASRREGWAAAVYAWARLRGHVEQAHQREEGGTLKRVAEDAVLSDPARPHAGYRWCLQGDAAAGPATHRRARRVAVPLPVSQDRA
jgi:hypothetical protein